MANSSYDTNANETVKVWSEKTYRSILKDIFFGKHMGGPESIVYKNTALTAKQGDRIRFPLINRSTTGWITGNDSLRGREDRITSSTMDVEIEAYRRAYMDDGALSRQRTQFNLNLEQANKLKGDLREFIDQKCIDTLTASPTKILYGGTASSVGTLATGDVLTAALMGRIATYAKTMNDRADGEPISQIRIPGYGDCYVLLVSPAAANDLRSSSTFRSEVVQADVRGDSNFAFTGILGKVNGVLIVENDRIKEETTGGVGGNVRYAKNILVGASALCWAECMPPVFSEISDDHGWKKGTQCTLMFGIKASEFDSKRYGSLAVYTAATSVS